MESEFFLVLQADRRTPIYDNDGDVLIQRKADGTQFYVSPDCFSTPNKETDVQAGPSDLNNTQNSIVENEESPEGETRQWTKNQILSLINHYKINKSLFNSTTIKNIKVWQKIAQELGSHTAKQCENKFKYLRSKYLQKKDNMSHKSSGARHIYFDYFEQMDEIFCKEPIVQPVAIASSSRRNPVEATQPTDSNPMDLNNNDTTEHSPRTRSRRSIKLKDSLNELNNILKEAEANKQRRHLDLIELQRSNMDKFSELMGKILDKM